MPIVTVSRQRGSMGSYVALEVAQRLDLDYLDREIIDTVAREAGVPAKNVEAIEEQAWRLARVLHLLGAQPRLPAVASASIREKDTIEGQVSVIMEREGLSREAAFLRLESTGGLQYAPRQAYLELLTSVIVEYAANGNVIIVGRGGQMILRGRPGVLHLHVGARFETRVFNIIQREGVKWREAAHRVRMADEQRAGYLRRFHNVDWLDASLYDVMINTDQIPCEVAVEMVIEAAQAVDATAREA